MSELGHPTPDPQRKQITCARWSFLSAAPDVITYLLHVCMPARLLAVDVGARLAFLLPTLLDACTVEISRTPYSAPCPLRGWNTRETARRVVHARQILKVLRLRLHVARSTPATAAKRHEKRENTRTDRRSVSATATPRGGSFRPGRLQDQAQGAARFRIVVGRRPSSCPCFPDAVSCQSSSRFTVQVTVVRSWPLGLRVSTSVIGHARMQFC